MGKKKSGIERSMSVKKIDKNIKMKLICTEGFIYIFLFYYYFTVSLLTQFSAQVVFS